MVKTMRIITKAEKEIYEVEEVGDVFFTVDLPLRHIDKKDCVVLVDKITSLDEYQKLAARTLPDLNEFYVGNIMIDNLLEDSNIVHCMYGIDTEIGEILDLYKKSFAYRKIFDKVNLLEEVCDVMWYVAAGCTISKVNLSNLINRRLNFNGSLIPNNDYPTLDIMAELYNNIKDYHKNKLQIDDIIELLVESEEQLFKGLTNNINKLIIRYPDKFTNNDAVNRNLDIERNELEK
jgi:hypothetical protein